MYKIAIALALSLLVAPQKQSTFHQQFATSGGSQEATVILGDVAVRRALNGNIVVIADRSLDGSTLPDGVPDLVFRFAPQTKDISRYNDVSFNLSQAQIFFQPGQLAVISKDNHVMISLSVEGSTKDDNKVPTYTDQSRDLPNTVRLSQGIGLVRQWPKLGDDSSKPVFFGKTSKPSKLPALIDLEADFVIRRGMRPMVDEGGGVSCSSGGQGATSCSITCEGGRGCSVTCGTGYWSCCNCGNCKCVDKALIE